MSRRYPRPIYFVCCAATLDGNLVAKTIQAPQVAEAIEIFKKEFCISPQQSFGPFYKKRTQILEKTRELKFTNQIKRAEYNGWLVNAFFLKIPEDHAYLVFIKRIDDKKLPIPQGTITVPISELRIL
jgi:hypothetical protein